MSSEQRLEQRLVQGVKRLGGIAIKFEPPGWAGAPDRILLLPGGRTMFVEVKAPGQRPRALQRYRAEQLQALGFATYVVASDADLAYVLGEASGDAV